MCYKFAQEEEEITRSCKHIFCKHIFSFKCDFHKASFSMWDFLPSLRLRIFSALVGDFSENLKEKLARVQKKEKRLRYFLRKISGEEKLKMSDGRSTPGSGISVRIWSGPGKSPNFLNRIPESKIHYSCLPFYVQWWWHLCLNKYPKATPYMWRKVWKRKRIIFRQKSMRILWRGMCKIGND